MRVALCISGHMRSFARTYENQLKNLILPNNCDVFIYTSDVISQRKNLEPEYISRDGETYNNPKWFAGSGILYNVDKTVLENKIADLYGHRLKKLVIENEKISDNQINNKTWEWYRKTFEKTYKCNKMLQDYCRENNVEYDIVIRSRSDLEFEHTVDVKKEIKKGNPAKDLYLFGGWDPRGNLSAAGYKEYAFDGFCFGTMQNMDIYCNCYEMADPYNDVCLSLEPQLHAYLFKNDFKLNYVGESKNKNSRWYKIIR